MIALAALCLLASPRQPLRLVVEGYRPPSEAVVGTAAMKYLPFLVPSGVTRLSITPRIDDGPGPDDRNTVDLGLFDERGVRYGFRGWEGGTRKPFEVTGDRSTTSPPMLPGPIHPGKWHLAQYFLRAGRGGLRYRYEITMAFDGRLPRAVAVPRYSPQPSRNATGWYAGNLHCHSLVSDGTLPFGELVKQVRDEGFDFMVSTEHNTPAAHYDFASSSLPGFLMIEGNELTMPSGHAGVLGQRPGDWYDFRTQAGDHGLPSRIEKAHRQGAVFVINHPFALCTTCTWSFLPDEWKGADGVEVWNGAWDATDARALRWWNDSLRANEHLNAYGGSDFHRGHDPMAPACFVQSRELSRAAIMRGLRLGRTCISESPRGPRIVAALDGAALGSTIRSSRASVLNLEVLGGRSGQMLIVIGRTGVIARRTIGSGATRWHIGIDTRGQGFVRAELRNPDGGMSSLTNAIFVHD